MNVSQEIMLREVHNAVVGNEALGHVGLVKRMSSAEEKLEKYKPVIDAQIEKKEDSKKLRVTIVAGCITFIAGLATHIVIMLNHR